MSSKKKEERIEEEKRKGKDNKGRVEGRYLNEVIEVDGYPTGSLCVELTEKVSQDA